MADSAMNPVQQAVYALLTGDATLMAMIAGIFDSIPETSEPTRYVVIGQSLEVPSDTFGKYGSDELLGVDCFAEDTADASGWKTVKAIHARVMLLLHGGTLSVSGRAFVLCELEDAQSIDGAPWRQIAAQYRIQTEVP